MSQNSQGNTFAGVSFLIKFPAYYRPATSLKRDPNTDTYFAEHLRTNGSPIRVCLSIVIFKAYSMYELF